jgi:hypothetical protein
MQMRARRKSFRISLMKLKSLKSARYDMEIHKLGKIEKIDLLTFQVHDSVIYLFISLRESHSNMQSNHEFYD